MLDMAHVVFHFLKIWRHALANRTYRQRLSPTGVYKQVALYSFNSYYVRYFNIGPRNCLLLTLSMLYAAFTRTCFYADAIAWLNHFLKAFVAHLRDWDYVHSELVTDLQISLKDRML
jgi:hypothetical protein